jgi:TonB family protein
MQDAVAEVLGERRALVARRSPFLIASVSLHLLIGILVLVIAQRSAAIPRSSALKIRLAPAASAPTVVQPASPAPVAKPAAPPSPDVKPKVVKPAEVKTAKKKPVEKTLFGKSTEKPVPAPPQKTLPAPATQAAAPRSTTGSIAAGTAGIAGLEGGDFPYTIYIDRMLTLVGSHWFRPETSAELTTQVYFVIERDGRVRDVKIEKPSGNNSFDRAAQRAVLESSPLPPLPFAYSGTSLGVHLTFH